MAARSGQIVLFASRRPLDQFAGVPAALHAHGIEVCYERLWDRAMRFGHHANPDLLEGARAVAFADLSHNAHLAPTRLAREMGIPTVLLVDGVVEHAATMRNPWLGPDHLQRTPHDRVLAMGPLQAKILADLGNAVATTGLPRLDGFEQRIAEARDRTEPQQWLLVATALTPAMDDDALARVRTMLRELRDATTARTLDVRWRIDAALALDLGVQPDTAPLTESLAGARATITTASTLAVESMLAGVPTAIAHPHPWPLWVPAAWIWADALDASVIADLPIEHVRTCPGTLDALLADPDLERQRTILAQLHTPDAGANVAHELVNARRTGNTDPIPSMARVRIAPAPCDTLYLALCDHEQPRPPMVDAALAAMRTRPRDHLLCIGLSPLNFADARTPALHHPRAREVVPDPTLAMHERAQAILEAALLLAPTQITFDDDRALPLAAQLAARGVRCDDHRLAQRTDHAVRSIEAWPWGPRSPADEAAADAWFDRELRHAGYERIALDAPSTQCDAVLVRAATLRPHPALVQQWRDRGLGVAVSPNGLVEAGVYAAQRAIDRLVARGRTRIAVVAHDQRTPVLIAPIRHGAPIVGWIDDGAIEPTTHAGLPAHAFRAGIDRLRPDALLVLHEDDLPRARATGLPTELVDLSEAAAHQLDHVAREAIHPETLARPRADGR
ncbi:hypothetical protein AY599_08685 [Leptolyngbya valderiana BDU 20041]|nr:hypothetical protein AY599_08685 [Leptolyngbya valderiana BDU 20041]